VQGMGGVGKTSLAIEYAHRFRDLYAGVWWCPAETRVGLLASLAGLGGELDPALKNEADVEKAAQAALRSLAEQRATWLLAYDNVTGPEAIADLLPSAGARVLLTSRFSDFASWAEEVALDVLPLGEATGFLQSHTSRTDAAGATSLAEAVERARAGDQAAIDGLERVGRYLGIGIGNMITVISPDRVVIGGGVSAAGDLLLASARDEIRRRVRTTSITEVELVIAELGTWAGAIGAAVHGAEHAAAAEQAVSR